MQAAVWGGKMTPSAVLVIKDGSVRMVPVNNNDPVSKIIDMAPDVIHRFMNKSEDDVLWNQRLNTFQKKNNE